MKLKILDTPDAILKAIPKEIGANLEFRRDLHANLTDDIVAQKQYMELCFAKPQIAFNSAFFTYNPRKRTGYRNIPFILRPTQDEAVTVIKDAIDNQYDLIIDKSRDEGATELVCKMFILYFWLAPDSSFLVGSRKEQLVDNSVEFKDGRLIGPHLTLFHKLLYGLVHLPLWARPAFNKKHLFIQNLDNNAMINGESTNESFGAGDRATAAFPDEIARVEPEVAQSIIDNIHDTSDCCIYNSTHFKWGAGHPYAKLLRGNKIKTIILGFESNPEKNRGLYKSPDLDVIEIHDIKYYRDKCPEVFNNIKAFEPFKLSKLENELLTYPLEVQKKIASIKFVADGGQKNFGRLRSAWFDATEARARRKQDLAQNVLRIPQGSADMFFDNETVEKIRAMFIREPDYYGRFKFDVVEKSITNIEFMPMTNKGRFKWWGKLVNLEPDTTHSYIVACDISRGTGASNSVLSVCDVNTQEIVGLYASPFIDVSDFAELAIAICKWLGNAYLIWEANGPGDTFDNRVIKYSYPRIYINRNERATNKARSKFRGWRNTRGENGTKMDMLSQLDVALAESLKSEPTYRYLIIHDEKLANELLDYCFKDGRVDAGLSTADDTTGAQYAHGDRVISVGLCVLAMNHVHPNRLIKQRIPSKNSFEYRRRLVEREDGEYRRNFIRERWNV